MRSQTRLRKHLEPGWTLRTPGVTTEDPITGNTVDGPAVEREVSVSIQQRLLTGMTEVAAAELVDERVAVILPPVDVPQTADLVSPAGEVWKAAGRGIIRRSAYRRPKYTSVTVRRATESDHQ